MRFYADENFPLPVVVELRSLGHDVLTALEDGRANRAIPDEKVLTRSSKLERAILTINRKDFIRLHTDGRLHAGIFVCTIDFDFVGQAERIHQACGPYSDMNNQLVRINRPG